MVEDIAPKLLKQQGDEIVYGAQKGGTDAGIDLISKNDEGKYVVTEVKFTRQSKTPGKGMMSSTRQTGEGEARQMTEDWIENSIKEEINPGDMANYEEARRAIETGNYEKKVIVVQDGASKNSITKGLAEFVDDVTIVRTDKVTKSK